MARMTRREMQAKRRLKGDKRTEPPPRPQEPVEVGASPKPRPGTHQGGAERPLEGRVSGRKGQ